MSILDWFKKPDIKVEANPITVNSPDQYKRNIHRIYTLYLAIEQGDYRLEVRKELNDRLEICKQFGNTPPANLTEAMAMIEKVGS
jgi:hypothetical protein